MSETKLLLGAVLVALLGAAVLTTCEKVPLIAAPGSSVFLQANPPFVIANGGRSVVTALVTEPVGTLAPDGTQVLFLTTLGQIDETGKTVDGIARVNFVADSRSGTATITAICGGAAATPSGSPSPSPSTSTSPAALGFVGAAAVGAGRPRAAGGPIAQAGSADCSATTTIAIGSTLPKTIILTADPQRITNPRRSGLTATVYDSFGNPVQNVPVVFAITNTSNVEETLDSGGAPQYTDSNGQAFDTLRTRHAPGTEKKVTISATAANGLVSNTLTVFVE